MGRPSMKALNLPMDDGDYYYLVSKRHAVSEALGLKKDMAWRRFLLLFKEVHLNTLIKAGKKLHYDSEGSEAK